MLAEAGSGYVAALIQAIVALAAVCAAAALLLRWAAGRGLGRVGRGARLELVERLPLEPGAALCLVRVDGRDLLVGTAASRPPTLVLDLNRGAAFRAEYVRGGDASSTPVRDEVATEP